MIERLFQKTKSKKSRGTLLCMKARIYFEMDKIDSLMLVCDFVQTHKDYIKIAKNIDVFQFYQDYIEKQYSRCIDYCDRVQNSLHSKSYGYKLKLVNNLFNYAIVYYNVGDWCLAKDYFSKLIDCAPKLYISTIACEYLNAIATKEKISIKVKDFDKNKESVISEVFFKRKNLAIFILFLSLVLLIISIIPLFFEHSTYQNEVNEFEENLNMALQIQYEEYRVVDYFNLIQNDIIMDSCCIIQDESGEYDIGFLVTSGEGEKLEFLCAVNNIKEKNRYNVKSITGTHSILIDVSDKGELEKKNYNKQLEIVGEDVELSLGFSIFQ